MKYLNVPEACSGCLTTSKLVASFTGLLVGSIPQGIGSLESCEGMFGFLDPYELSPRWRFL